MKRGMVIIFILEAKIKMNEMLAENIICKRDNQFMSRSEEMDSVRRLDGDENLKSVIHNLRCIIVKQNNVIERLTRQLAEEKVLNLQSKGG